MENLPPALTEICIPFLGVIGLGIGFYVSLIIGLEIGGRMSGYPGRGIEIHEEIFEKIFKQGNRPKK